MKIYTKKGDAGQTALFGGARVSKSSLRVAAYGDVDELNSILGVVRAHDPGARVEGELSRIQSELFDLGAELARDPDSRADPGSDRIDAESIERLESSVDELERDLLPLKQFILPGGCASASFLHVARTTCRRAERAAVALGADGTVRGELLAYLNRLSDLLFVMARHENHARGVEDVPWVGRRA